MLEAFCLYLSILKGIQRAKSNKISTLEDLPNGVSGAPSYLLSACSSIQHHSNGHTSDDPLRSLFFNSIRMQNIVDPWDTGSTMARRWLCSPNTRGGGNVEPKQSCCWAPSLPSKRVRDQLSNQICCTQPIAEKYELHLREVNNSQQLWD